MMKRLPAPLLASALIAFAAGCARQTPPPAPAAWDWSQFPREDRLLVAEVPARAAPARLELIQAPAAGILRLTPGLDFHEPIPASTVWARIESLDTTGDEAAARLGQEIERRRSRFLALDRPALIAQADREIHAAEESAAAAEFAEKHPGLFQGDRPLLDPALRPALSPGQLADLIRSLREKRDQLQTGDAAAEPGDLQALRAELERTQRAAAQRRQQLQLSAPFAGVLSLADPADGRNVQPGAPLALLSDPSSLRLRVRASSFAAGSSSSLEIEALLPGGTAVRAACSGSSFESGDRIISVLWFDTAVDRQVLSQLGAAGAEVPARIFLRLPSAACVVPKLLVARYDRQNALAAGWRDAVTRLFPGAKFVAEGRTAVAIEPPAP